ncbi:MAG: acyl-CoA reductase [Bacteroidota bacterium]
MNTISQRIEGVVKLGRFLSQFTTAGIEKKEHIEHNDLFFEPFRKNIILAEQNNGWFTKDNILYTLTHWSAVLKHKTIASWLGSYSLRETEPKKVALIMAGNIPLVGFHDFLSVLLTGHSVTVKLSSKDNALLPILAQYLMHTTPSLNGTIAFTEGQLSHFDAAIATGSNNTMRYFEYYFGKKPNIIRKNRNSVAVLNGKETNEQLEVLGHDIFTYYGLGCRNVSKLFVPEGYDFNLFFNAIYPYHPIINHKKYANNYDYNKAIYLMSLFNILENGFVMLKEDKGYASPIATVFYEYYTDTNTLKTTLDADKDSIQCIVADGFSESEIPFGKTQQPRLWDYADGIDTMDFLLHL